MSEIALKNGTVLKVGAVNRFLIRRFNDQYRSVPVHIDEDTGQPNYNHPRYKAALEQAEATYSARFNEFMIRHGVTEIVKVGDGLDKPNSKEFAALAKFAGLSVSDKNERRAVWLNLIGLDDANVEAGEFIRVLREIVKASGYTLSTDVEGE